MLSRVSPFRYLRIVAHVQLPAAFRSLSRLSSALSAKASTLRSCLLNLSPFMPSVTLLGLLPSYFYEGLLALFCVSFDTRVCCCKLSGMLCIPWPRMSCHISFLQTLILKILIQYSVFKVQRNMRLHATEQLRCEVHCTDPSLCLLVQAQWRWRDSNP